MALALEKRAWLNREGRRDNVAQHFGVTLKFDALGGMQIAAQNSVYDRGSHHDVRLNLSGFAHD